MRKWPGPGLVITLIAVGAMLAIAVPNFLTALERSRMKRTMADMRSIATAMEARATDVKSYGVGTVRHVPPGTFHRVPFAEVERALSPVYIRNIPRVDGWGEPFRVYLGQYDEKARAQAYLIRSFGSDRRADTSRYTLGRTAELSEDIVFAQGNFIRYSEGI